ncbi:DNA cytosine methyltransferase, partial [Streptomyces sp. NPDC048279]|uniref:DNA cytosine methyltransferase n=1 Tax=Streptomyces sp. NPDC048279 TaxID=3154714 RepID=UPI0034148E32
MSTTGHPFRQFIVKVHGRCNLACTYCYLYEGPDRTWRTRPAAASPAVLDRTADRIAEHARGHGLTAVSLVLHGGEPLLAGVDTLARFTEAVHAGGVPCPPFSIAGKQLGANDERDLF